MNKLIIILAALIVLMTACAAPKNENVPDAMDEVIEEKVDEEVDEELNDENLEPTDLDIIEEVDLAKEIKIDTGRFNGLADANFFEVKISGVPDSIPPKVFMLTDEVREKFEKLNLQQDDEIKLHYYETENGQLEVTDIEKITQ